MKVIVVKAPKIDNNIDETITKFLNSIRCEDSNTVTKADIENSVAFKKTQAAISILDTLTALQYIDNPNEVSKEVFDRYVSMGNIIDSFFENLIQDYIDKQECNNCENCDEYAPCGKCSLKCDIMCGDCEHCDECIEEESSMCEDCESGLCMEDAMKLASIFKPAFNIEDVSENDKEITITMTGKEYLEIKEILDKYEFTEEDDSEV